VGGYIVDKTGNWELTFVAGIGLLLAGAIMAFWMKPEETLDAAHFGQTPKAPAVILPAV
jgi:hypothetical protein